MRAVLRLFAALVLAAAVLAFHPIALRSLARFLVKQDGPCRADIAVVLAGGWSGNRILKAGELVRQGYAPKALVSSPGGHYGLVEADVAIPFAVRHGYPDSLFEAFRIQGDSTREEAVEIVRELRRRGTRKILLITSDYHTRRSGRIYRSLAPEIGVCVVAAPDPGFLPDHWWKHRPSQKTLFYEWLKLVTGELGI